MEVYGSIEGLKKALEEDYRAKLRKVNSRKAAQLKEIRNSLKKHLALVEAELKQEADSKLREANAMVLNEQKLSAKRSFEEAREKMVQAVLSEVRESFPTVMKSKPYLDFVKKNSPKDAVVFGNPFFGSHFGKLRVDENLMGVRFVKGSVIYDLSLNALLEAKEFAVREKAIEALW